MDLEKRIKLSLMEGSLKKIITKRAKILKMLPKLECFILGNGPNLPLTKLHLLNDKLTISCKHFARGFQEKNVNFFPKIGTMGDIFALKDYLASDFNFGTIFKLYPEIIMIIGVAPLLGVLKQSPKETKELYINKIKFFCQKYPNFFLIKDENNFILKKNFEDIDSKDIKESI